jgi:lipoate synthase
MDVTIGLTQLKRKKLDDGTIPIYIRCTENRRSRYRSTGISVLKSEWNIRKKAVNSKHRNQEKLNIILDRKEREVKEIREDLYRKGKLTLDNLMEALLIKPPNTKSI